MCILIGPRRATAVSLNLTDCTASYQMGRQLTDCGLVCPETGWHCGHRATNPSPCQVQCGSATVAACGNTRPGGLAAQYTRARAGCHPALRAGAGGRCGARPHGELRCAELQEPEKQDEVCVQGPAGRTGSAGGPGCGTRPLTHPPSSSPGSAPQGVFCPKRGERSACTGVLKREEGSYCSCYFSNPFSPQSGCGFLGRMFRVHITHSTSSGPG